MRLKINKGKISIKDKTSLLNFSFFEDSFELEKDCRAGKRLRWEETLVSRLESVIILERNGRGPAGVK